MLVTSKEKLHLLPQEMYTIDVEITKRTLQYILKVSINIICNFRTPLKFLNTSNMVVELYVKFQHV